MQTWRRGFTLVLLFTLTVLGLGRVAGAQPIAPGTEEEPPAPGQVVQSWALFPAGADNPDQPGNRANLTYQVPPGSTIDDAVTVANYGNVGLELRVYPSDAFNNPDGGFNVLGGDTAPSDVGAWVKTDQEFVIVEPGRQVTLPIKIVVPADAAPGDHVGAVLAAQRVGGTGPDGKVVQLDRRTGTRIYLRVDGQASPDLAVENLRTSYSPSVNPLSGTAQISYTIVNRGNVRLAGTRQTKVGGPFGLMSKSSEATFNEILPGGRVEVTETIDGVPATGALFTEVKLEPTQVEGAPAGSPPPTSKGSSLSLALPITLVALAAVVVLLFYARYRYRHRNAPPPPPPSTPAPRRVPEMV